MAAPMEMLPVGEMILAPESTHTPASANGRVSGAVHSDAVFADVAHHDFASGECACRFTATAARKKRTSAVCVCRRWRGGGRDRGRRC